LESLIAFLDSPDGPDDLLLSLSSFSPHPRSGFAAKGSDHQPFDVRDFSQVHQSVSYRPIPERLRNAATSARAFGTFEGSWGLLFLIFFPCCICI
jgi:hypothetical protein